MARRASSLSLGRGEGPLRGAWTLAPPALSTRDSSGLEEPGVTELDEQRPVGLGQFNIDSVHISAATRPGVAGEEHGLWVQLVGEKQLGK